jgi:hypothetical protein
MCENFGGYLQTGLHNPHVKFGFMGRFIERALRDKLIRKDNFPNLVLFATDISEMTTNFTQELDCDQLEMKYPKLKLWQWAINEIKELF